MPFPPPVRHSPDIIDPSRHNDLDGLPFLVYEFTSTDPGTRPGASAVVIRDGIQGTGLEAVITVDPVEDIPSRTSETAVDRIALASVFFRYPVRQVSLMPFDDIDATVRRASIHNDIFEIGIALTKDGIDRRLEVACLIIGRCNDTNTRTIQGLYQYRLLYDRL